MIPGAPSSFSGTLAQLYERFAKSVLPKAAVVQEFHEQLLQYLETADPIFVIRKVRQQERRTTLRTARGFQLRPTDNAPAWWIHYQLFSGEFRRFTSFDRFVENIPTHMFDVRVRHVNSAGWAVPHIFPVKDRNVDFETWDRQELARRTVRNIHPCNYFFVPLTEWQRHEGNSTVIAFFYAKFESMYRDIWPSFLKLAGGAPIALPAHADAYSYAFPTIQPDRETRQTSHTRLSKISPREQGDESTPLLHSLSAAPPHRQRTQRDVMRQVYAVYGHDLDRVVREYAAAERRGEAPRSSNNTGMRPEQYARALLNDGLKKGWL